MSETPLVLHERVGRLVRLTLNRADVRNALNLDTLKELRAHLAQIAEDVECWVVVLTGAGEQAFCAGADLKERRTMDESAVQNFVREIRATMDDVAALPQPTVAAIQGHAFGGGCELALSCDLRILAPEALIGLTETRLAIIPGAGGCVRLPRLVGEAKAKELILTAKRLDAQEALASGLVHRVGGAACVEDMVDSLLSKGPLALRAAKAAIDGGSDLPMAEALRWEFECYQRILSTADRLEALTAFAEKRPARFEGR